MSVHCLSAALQAVGFVRAVFGAKLTEGAAEPVEEQGSAADHHREGQQRPIELRVSHKGRR